MVDGPAVNWDLCGVATKFGILTKSILSSSLVLVVLSLVEPIAEQRSCSIPWICYLGWITLLWEEVYEEATGEGDWKPGCTRFFKFTGGLANESSSRSKNLLVFCIRI